LSKYRHKITNTKYINAGKKRFISAKPNKKASWQSSWEQKGQEFTYKEFSKALGLF